MWWQALERGLAGAVAKQLLAGKVDLVFAPIERAGALRPEQLAKLRAELTANLQKAEAEGAPYVDMVSVAAREMLTRWPDVRDAVVGVGRVAVDAAQKAAEAARAEVQKAAADAAAKRTELAKVAKAAGEP